MQHPSFSFITSFITFLAQEKRASEHTQFAYKRDLEQFFHYATTSNYHDLQKTAEKFFASLTVQGITASSIARKISCFNSFKKYLKREGIAFPLAVKRPPVLLADPLSLPLKDVLTILDLVGIGDIPSKRPYRDTALLEVIYATGITCHEVVTIEINCIDFTEQSIIIRNKRKKERSVPFGAQAAVSIKAYIENERKPIQNGHEKLFLNHRNKPLTPRSVQRICLLFRQILEKKRNVTPSVLRSSCAAHLITNGAPLEQVQELLGHKTRISTQRYKKVRT